MPSPADAPLDDAAPASAEDRLAAGSFACLAAAGTTVLELSDSDMEVPPPSAFAAPPAASAAASAGARAAAPEALGGAVAQLVAAIGVSEARASVLLEAVGGDVARAADLHFAQGEEEASQASAPAPSSAAPPAPQSGAAHRAPPAAEPAPQERRPRPTSTPPPTPKRARGRGGSGAGGGAGGSGTASGLDVFFGPRRFADAHDGGSSAAAAEPAAPSDLGATGTGRAEPPITTAGTAEQAPGGAAAAGAALVVVGTAPSASSTAPASAPPKPRGEVNAAAGVEYACLTRAFARLAATTKRKEKDAILLETFRDILEHSPDDLVPAVYLSSNTLGPPWEGLDLNVGGAAINSAVKAATGASAAELSAMWKQTGDPGDVAAAVRARQRLLCQPAALTVRKVYQSLLGLCAMSGEGCAQRRVNTMAGLIRAARDSEETRFLVRTFACHIRTQATLTTVKDAAVAAIVEYRSRRQGAGAAGDAGAAQRAARECFTACPDVRRVLEPLLHGGVEAMRRACAFSVGTPMRPMLARAETSVDSVVDSIASDGGAFACEFKYDGQRAQIHRDASGLVRIFSRHLEDMTAKFPDVVAALGAACTDDAGRPRPFVVDAEVVAVGGGGEAATGEGKPPSGSALRSDAFQRLSTRKRKDVTIGSIEVAVKVFAFDLLFIDGSTTIGLPFVERRRLLHGAFEPNGAFGFADYSDVPAEAGGHADGADAEPGAPSVARADRVQEALERALAENCEGLMCKALSAPYEPSDGSKRSTAWLKLKADYIDGLGDTLDLVPIGGWHGLGRKAKWISPFLLACWDPETEQLQSVCRVLSGFTDTFYAEKTLIYVGDAAAKGGHGCEEIEQDGDGSDDDDAGDDQLRASGGAEVAARSTPRPGSHSRSGPDPRVLTDEAPAMWFRPFEVWEVKGANLSLSPKHKAAVGHLHPERGLSLRFPRFIRVRTDKRIEDATTAAQLADMFRRQQAGGCSGLTRGGADRGAIAAGGSGGGAEPVADAGADSDSCASGDGEGAGPGDAARGGASEAEA